MLLNIKLVFLLTLGHLCSLGGSTFLSFWRDRDIKKAPHLCPNRWELLGAIRAGGPLRLLVQPKQTVVLQCRFCEDPEEIEDDDDIGMWTYVDIVRRSAPVRVPRLIVGNSDGFLGNFLGYAKKPRIALTEGQGLALRKPHTIDLGLYQCQRDNDKSPIQPTIRFLVDMDITLFEEQLKQEKENKLNDQNDEDGDTEDDESSTTEDTSTVKDEEINFIIKSPNINGTSDDWPIYRKVHLDALDKFIARSNLHLEAMSEWSAWTDCSQCWSTKYGVRARRGVCVLRLPLHESADDDVTLTELAGMPALACRSAVLHQLHPKISDIARKVPDFVEYDYRGCNGVCLQNTSKSHGSLLHRLFYLFRHRRDTPLITHKKLMINAGDALVIVCPGATGETPVNWQKDGETIGGGSPKAPVHSRSSIERAITDIRKVEHWVSGQIVGIKSATENTPFIDTTGVLRITSAAPQNSGNYECSVNGITQGNFQVEVIVKSALSFDDLVRHFGYVSLVLLSGVMVWCGVVLCVTLRRRLQKNDYSVLPQTDNRHDRPRLPSTYDIEYSESHLDTSKVSRINEESTLNPTGSVNKRKQKPKSDVHPSRKAMKAISPGPMTASYHKVWSRFRTRLDSRQISANDDTELVHLMLPQPPLTYDPRNSERYYRQSSPTSSTSCDLDISADKRPVSITSQQAFPATQNVLRPAALGAVTSPVRSPTNPLRPSTSPLRSSTNPLRPSTSPLRPSTSLLRSSTSPLRPPTSPSPARTSISPLPRQAQYRAPSPADQSCSWSPSPISVSVLRARNSLRHTNTSSVLSNTPKQTKVVHSAHHLSSKSQKPSTTGVAKSNAHTDTRKKTTTGGKRHSKPNMSTKPKRPRSETSHRKIRAKLEKHTLISPSPSRSQMKYPERNRSIATSRTESKINPQSSSRSLASSKWATTPVNVSQKNSILRPEQTRSSKQASPRLSLLYKAPPSPKPGVSFSGPRNAVSCISFLSTSANSVADPEVAILESERSLALPVVSVGSAAQTNASVEKAVTPTPQKEAKPSSDSSPKRLSITKQPSESEGTNTAQSQRIIPTATSRPTPSPHSFVPFSESQQSMFQIPGIVDKQSLPQIPNLPLTSRQPPTFYRGTQLQPAQQSESLENMKLVAAFLARSAQKKARAPKKTLMQSSSVYISTTTSQNPLKSPRQEPIITSQPIVQTSGRSEIFYPSLPTPPTRSRISSSAKCNTTDSFSTSKAASQGLLIKPTEYAQRMQRKPSTAPTSSAPTQSKPDFQTKALSNKSLNSFPTTHLSQQLLPACLFPCAIALPDQILAMKQFSTGAPKIPPPPKLHKFEIESPAPPRKSTTCSNKSGTSTMHTSFSLITEHEVLTPLEKNTVPFLNVDSARRMDGKLEDERMSLRMIRNTNHVKEIRLRPSRGRNTSKSQLKKLVAVQKLDSSKYCKNKSDLLAIQETRRDNAFGSMPERFRAPRTETVNITRTTSDLVPEHLKISTKTPILNESLPHSDKTATTTLRKNTSTRYSKHKGFYVRQKPGMEKFEIVLVDTDPLPKENETKGVEQTEGSVAASRENLSSLLPKKNSKSHRAISGSVTKFATHAAAIAIPQIISTNLLWSTFSPLAHSNSNSQLRTTESSSEYKPDLKKSQLICSKPGSIPSEPKLIRVELQCNRTEFQPIPTQPQPTPNEFLPIRSEPQQKRDDQWPILLKHQPIRTKHQLIRSVPTSIRNVTQPIRSVPLPTRSEPLPNPKTTCNRDLETVRSESLYKGFRPRTFKVNSSVHLPSSRSRKLHFTISKKDLKSKNSKIIHGIMNRSRKNSNVSVPKKVRSQEFKFRHSETLQGSASSKTGSFASKTSQPLTSGFNPTAGSSSGPLPYKHVKLTQRLLESSPPSLLRLPSPVNLSKLTNGLKSSQSAVPSRTDLLASTSKTVNDQPPTHRESTFAVDLLSKGPTPASSQMTHIANRDIAVASNMTKGLFDSARDLRVSSRGTCKPAPTQRHRSFVDEATSNGSLTRSYIKSRSVRLPTTEIALQVSNATIQGEGLQRTNSLPKSVYFTPTRTIPAKANPLQASPKNQLTISGRTPRTTGQCTPLSSPPCNTHFETRSLNPPHRLFQVPHDTSQSRNSRIKSTQRVNFFGESRPKKHPIVTEHRGRTVRKPPEPFTPSRPKFWRSTVHMSPKKKSPSVKRSPQSPALPPGTPKIPSSTATARTQSCSLKLAAHCQEEGSENMFPLQDYDSHTIISQSNEGNSKTDKWKANNGDLKAKPPSDRVTVSQRNLRDSFHTTHPSAGTLQNPTQPPLSSEIAKNSLKNVFSGALAEAAHGILAISIPSKAASLPNILEFLVVKESPVPTTGDDISACSKVQSLDKTVSAQSDLNTNSQPNKHTIQERKSRNRKPNMQILNNEASVKRKLSTEARRKKPASGVFVFNAREFKQPRQRSNDRVTVPSSCTSAIDIKCNIWDVPDISTYPSFLEDGFTSYRGLPAKKSDQKELNSK